MKIEKETKATKSVKPETKKEEIIEPEDLAYAKKLGFEDNAN